MADKDHGFSCSESIASGSNQRSEERANLLHDQVRNVCEIRELPKRQNKGWSALSISALFKAPS